MSVSFLQAEDGIRDADVTGVQTCALPISQGLSTAISQVPSDRRRNTSDDRPCISSRLPVGSVPVSVQSDVYRATPSTSMNCSRRDTSAGFSAMKALSASRNAVVPRATFPVWGTRIGLGSYRDTAASRLPLLRALMS